MLFRSNRLLFETTSPERFVTIFYAVYDPSDRSLTWANAGHCSPLLMHTSGAARLDSLIQPAGIAPEVPVLQETIGVSPGDLLLIYSDGIPEACNQHEEEFGEARLSRLIRERGRLPASELCGAVLDNVKDYSRGCHQGDDLTVVAAKFLREGD